MLSAGPGGQYVTQEEHDRLAARLAELPTTEQEDLELLASGNLTDWRDRLLVELRVQRKKALRLTIDRLGQQLHLRTLNGEL